MERCAFNSFSNCQFWCSNWFGVADLFRWIIHMIILSRRMFVLVCISIIKYSHRSIFLPLHQGSGLSKPLLSNFNLSSSLSFINPPHPWPRPKQLFNGYINIVCKIFWASTLGHKKQSCQYFLLKMRTMYYLVFFSITTLTTPYRDG